MNGSHPGENALFGLRHAMPYLRLYRGEVFVLKLGGALCAEPLALHRLLEQAGLLAQLGIRIVLVHGAGPEIDSLAGRLGMETRKVHGRRVTPPPMLEVVVMSMNGSVNTSLIAAAHGLGVPAVGLSAISAGLVRAVRRPPVMTTLGPVDFGEVGDIASVDPHLLRTLLGAGFVPVVSPTAATDDGRVLNLNADGVASAVASALGARKLIFFLDQPGILEEAEDPASLVSSLDLEGLEAMVTGGSIQGGMLPKTRAAREALEQGVPRVHFVSAFTQDALLREVFTNEGSGTLLVRVREELSLEERSRDELPADPPSVGDLSVGHPSADDPSADTPQSTPAQTAGFSPGLQA